MSKDACEILNFDKITNIEAFDEGPTSLITLRKAEAEISFLNETVIGNVEVSPHRSQSTLHGCFVDALSSFNNDELEKFYISMSDVMPIKKVFISYSHKDKRFVKGLVKSLKDRGVSVWIDECELLVGDSLISKLREALDNVDYVLAVISESSISSNWVKHELDIAMNQEIDGRCIKVLPAVRDNVDLPGFLKGKVWADFRKPWRRKASLDAIVQGIERV